MISNEGARDKLSLEDSVRPSPLSLHSTSPLGESKPDPVQPENNDLESQAVSMDKVASVSAHTITGVRRAGITDEELSRVLEASHEDEETQ